MPRVDRETIHTLPIYSYEWNDQHTHDGSIRLYRWPSCPPELPTVLPVPRESQVGQCAGCVACRCSLGAAHAGPLAMTIRALTLKSKKPLVSAFHASPCCH